MPRIATLLATWFGSGNLPKAPGTWGALAALPFAWVIVTLAGSTGLLLAAILLFAAGCWAADGEAAMAGTRDPSWVVVDEVVGQWLTLVLVPLHLLDYLFGFLLFRLFDIWKPWPVNWSERRFGGGFGIMIDDVVAAAYAMAVFEIGRALLER